MKLVVTHLTRMDPGYVCVAGQDAATRASVRPVVPGRRLPRDALASEGGAFAVGRRAHLFGVRPCGRAPEVEDHTFERASADAAMAPDAFWSLLSQCARPSLQAIFGPALALQGHTAALPVGRGAASLGILRPAQPPSLALSESGVRLEIADPLGRLSVAVTDLRLFGADHKSVDAGNFERLSRRLRAQECLLAVGVGRHWTKPGDSAPRHWLQVNNVHFSDTADWSA